jgi:hypothetical protein
LILFNFSREVQKKAWKPYEIQISDENLPNHQTSNIRKREKGEKTKFTSPKRHLIKNQRIESTAKKNHSSSSQVHNFSREDHNERSDKKPLEIGRNIHMRETFKCGEDNNLQNDRLGFSFLENQKRYEKESLALWKNVSMPLSSPCKAISKAQNKENVLKSSLRQSNRRNRNPFNDSKESNDGRVNSSKTRLIKFNNENGGISKESNVSSLANNQIRKGKNSRQNLKPIWQDSPLTSFNQIQSFKSENKSTSMFNNLLSERNGNKIKTASTRRDNI